MIQATNMTQAEADAGITYAELGIELQHDFGQRKTFCPRCHHTRKNQSDPELSVDVDAGTWTCHHVECGWVSGLAAEAQRKHGTPVTRVSVTMPPALEDWAVTWFADRSISRTTLDAYKIRSASTATERVIHFPYVTGGKLVNKKRRWTMFDGETEIDGRPVKRFKQEHDARRTMFGMHVVPADARGVIITEGELDAMACFEAGWANVISLPDGAAKSPTDGKLAALDDPHVKALLDRSEIIIIATDADEPGRLCHDALVARLDAVKCWSVQWPEGINDANALLMRDGRDALDEAINNAVPVDLDGIHDFRKDFATARRLSRIGHEPGASTGFETLDQFMTLHKGAVYVWTGIPSHGKTTMLMNVLMNACKFHEWKGAVFSPEMGTPATVLLKLSQMFTAKPVLPGADVHVTETELDEAMEWIADRLWLIDASHRDEESYATIGLPELLKRAERQHLRTGIDFLVLDPWNRLDASRPKHMNETDYVAYGLNALGRFAKRHMISVHVVAHPTKQEAGKSGEQEAMPTPYSIAGSAHWYAMADFIIGVHRKKWTTIENDPDKDITTIRTWKVREEGDQGALGEVRFRFNPTSRRFYDPVIGAPSIIGADGWGAFADRVGEYNVA
jgi:twinkle protein